MGKWGLDPNWAPANPTRRPQRGTGFRTLGDFLILSKYVIFAMNDGQNILNLSSDCMWHTVSMANVERLMCAICIMFADTDVI